MIYAPSVVSITFVKKSAEKLIQRPNLLWNDATQSFLQQVNIHSSSGPNHHHALTLTHWGRDKMAAVLQTMFVFKCIFLNGNVWISLKISLKFVPKVPINNIPALVPILAWRRSGDKPLFEPMMVSLLTHICVTRPQWVNKREHVLKKLIWLIYLQGFSDSNPLKKPHR